MHMYVISIPICISKRTKRGRFRTAEQQSYWYSALSVLVFSETSSPATNGDALSGDGSNSHNSDRNAEKLVGMFKPSQVVDIGLCGTTRSTPTFELLLTPGHYRIVTVCIPFDHSTSQSYVPASSSTSSSDTKGCDETLRSFTLRLVSAKPILIVEPIANSTDPLAQTHYYNSVAHSLVASILTPSLNEVHTPIRRKVLVKHIVPDPHTISAPTATQSPAPQSHTSSVSSSSSSSSSALVSTDSVIDLTSDEDNVDTPCHPTYSLNPISTLPSTPSPTSFISIISYTQELGLRILSLRNNTSYALFIKIKLQLQNLQIATYNPYQTSCDLRYDLNNSSTSPNTTTHTNTASNASTGVIDLSQTQPQPQPQAYYSPERAMGRQGGGQQRPSHYDAIFSVTIQPYTQTILAILNEIRLNHTGHGVMINVVEGHNSDHRLAIPCYRYNIVPQPLPMLREVNGDEKGSLYQHMSVNDALV